jgi:hypothetical protein
MRTGKYINREKTPPIHPHKNLVAKITCPSLIDHLKLQKKFSGQAQPTVQQGTSKVEPFYIKIISINRIDHPNKFWKSV